MQKAKRKAVFLDRDGTVNKEVEYLSRVEDIEILPGVEEAIKAFRKAGYLVFIVTNQAGIAKKKLNFEDYHRVAREILIRLKKGGAKVDEVVFCPHHPDGVIPELTDNCTCRKPEPGMLTKLAVKYNLCLPECWMIGDKIIDIQAGWRAGCKTIMVRTGYGQAEEEKLAEMVVPHLYHGAIDNLKDAIKIMM